MSSAPRPNKIASLLRLPIVSKNLAGTLRQPTYMAIAASLGLHGVVGVGFAVVSPNGLGNSQPTTRMVETNLVELTPAEISRLPVVSTLPVGRLPSLNSNTLSAGTLPSLSGLPSSSSGTSGNSSQGLPPGPPPPLGSPEPTYGAGTFFGSRSSGYSDDYNSGYSFGNDSSGGSLSLADLQALIDWQAASVLGYNDDSRQNNNRGADDSELDRKTINLQNKGKRNTIPETDNEADSNAEDEETIGSADSPNSEDSEELIEVVRGILPPTVSLETIQGEYLVAVQVDVDGNIIGWELLEDSDNPVLIKTIDSMFQRGIQDARLNEGESQILVRFNENSRPPYAGGSEQREPLQLVEIARDNSESETANDSELLTRTLDPILYSAVNLSIPPEELPASVIVDIVVTPEGSIDPLLVESTGDETLDIFARNSALAWALEQKLGLDTPNTHQVTIPIELDVESDDRIETPPEPTTPEQTEEAQDTEDALEEKPIPPQSPAPETLEPEQPEPEAEAEVPPPTIPPSPPNSTGASPKKPRPENQSNGGLPGFPTEESTQSSTSNELTLEKDPLPNENKVSKKER